MKRKSVEKSDSSSRPIPAPKPAGARRKRLPDPKQATPKSNSKALVAKEESESLDVLTPSTKRNFPIVGVGASAGGLEAFSELLRHLPTDTGMAFVLVQHLDPLHESLLPSLLGNTTTMRVVQVKTGMRVRPNQVHVIPPNADMIVENRVLKLLPSQALQGRRRCIDLFFESLAKSQRQKAIGVVLSGTATDGTIGLEAIRE